MPLPFPREHGAWGILLIPPVVIASALGAWPARMWLLMGAVLGLFLARTALEACFGLEDRCGARASAADRRSAAFGLGLYLAIAAACGLPLVGYFGARWTLGMGAIAVSLSLIYFGLLHGYRRKTLAGEFFGVALLTLTAPASAYLLSYETGLAVRFWVIHYLFFLSGLLYVKTKLEVRKANAALETLAERITRGWPVLVYHAVLAGFVVAMARERWIPAGAMIAFAPIVARGFWGILRWERRLSLPHLGRSELLHSLLFALLMATAYHL